MTVNIYTHMEKKLILEALIMPKLMALHIFTLFNSVNEDSFNEILGASQI